MTAVDVTDPRPGHEFDVERLRVRMVGATYFIDAIVQVPRTYPIDRVEEVKRRATQAVTILLHDADVTITAVPVARNNESVRERVKVIARNSATRWGLYTVLIRCQVARSKYTPLGTSRGGAPAMLGP